MLLLSFFFLSKVGQRIHGSLVWVAWSSDVGSADLGQFYPASGGEGWANFSFRGEQNRWSGGKGGDRKFLSQNQAIF